jgi:hypothetical protein
MLESCGWEPRVVAALELDVDQLLAGDVTPEQVDPLLDFGLAPYLALDLVALGIQHSALKGWKPDDVEALYGQLQFRGSQYLLSALLTSGNLDAAYMAWHSVEPDE